MTPTTASASARIARRHPDELIVGLVSVSDRASAGVYADEGVPSLQAWLGTALASPWQAVERLFAQAEHAQAVRVIHVFIHDARHVAVRQDRSQVARLGLNLIAYLTEAL